MAANTRTDPVQPGQAADSVDSSDRAAGPTVKPGHLPISEMLSDRAGAGSPFGEDITFPLPMDRIVYELPSESETTDQPE